MERAARDLEREYEYAKADNGESNAAALLRYIAKAVEHVRAFTCIWRWTRSMSPVLK